MSEVSRMILTCRAHNKGLSPRTRMKVAGRVPDNLRRDSGPKHKLKQCLQGLGAARPLLTCVFGGMGPG